MAANNKKCEVQKRNKRYQQTITIIYVLERLQKAFKTTN